MLVVGPCEDTDDPLEQRSYPSAPPASPASSERTHEECAVDRSSNERPQVAVHGHVIKQSHRGWGGARALGEPVVGSHTQMKWKPLLLLTGCEVGVVLI